MIALLLLMASAFAADHHVVATGETVASIAANLAPSLGVDAAALATELRATNGLADAAEPVVGDILTVPQGAGADNAASVVALIGSGFAEGGGIPKTTLTRGLELPIGATICTNEDGYATVRLATAKGTPEAPVFSHDDVSLFPSTCLTVTGSFARNGGRSSLIELAKGGVTVRSADETPGVVTVVTASGTTSGDRGGFRVHVEESAARTEAIDSAVSVFGAGTQVAVAAGQGTRVETGKAPQAPVQLILGATLSKPENDALLRRPDFYWAPADRALGYQVELATREDFSEVIAQEQVSAAEWHPETLLVPFRVAALYWRVSSFDRSGFLGTPSEPRELRFPDGVGP